MAVTLPIVTIQDDAIATIVLDSFKGETDPVTGDPLTPQQAYRRWHREQLIERVAYKRAQQRMRAREEADRADLEAERTALQSI